MTAHSALQPVTEELILARLLVPPKKGLSLSPLKNQLYKLYKNRLGPGEWTTVFESAMERLLTAGLVANKPLQLTETGRQQALTFCGLDKVPPRATWANLLRTRVAPKLAGIAATQLAGAKKLPEAFAAAILQKEHGLAGTAKNPASVLSLLLWKELKLPDAGKPTVNSILSHLLLKRKPPEDAGQLCRLLAARLLDTTDTDLFAAAIDAAISRRLGQPLAGAPGAQPAASPQAQPGREELDLVQFAAKVQATAERCPSGRFGDNKVFISHLWRQLQSDPVLGHAGVEAFKARLLEAHRQGRLELNRADLVECMNPNDVAASEIKDLGSTFHFIKIPS